MKIIEIDDPNWDIYIQKLPLEMQDIYFTQSYYKMCEFSEQGDAKMAVLEQGDEIIVYPFILREITGYQLDDTYYDIETGYGYGGPTGNIHNEALRERFETEFLAYCKEQRVVCEFVRFHPLLQNENAFTQDMQVLQNRKTVSVDLTLDLEDMQKNQLKLDKWQRVKKAKRNGLEIVFQKNFDVFRNVYEATMNKVSADTYYYFNDEYYNHLQNNNAIYCYVKYGEIIIASSVFMEYSNRLHHHLTGSLKEYLQFAPNHFILWESICYAKENGFTTLHLGGGRTNEDDDSLFKFKKGFSKQIHNFYIGKRVLNQEIYEQLINEWKQKTGREQTLFLQYRQE